LRIALSTVAVGFLVLFLTPAEVHSGLMTAAIAIAVCLIVIELVRYWRETTKPANVWLDDAGLHWLDAQGGEQLLSRSLLRSYLIGHDEETRRDLASLTFVLDGGFLSQPVELHPPAEPLQVKEWLENRWALSASSGLPPERTTSEVYSELDLHDQRWLLEGDRDPFERLAQTFSELAKWPLPPPGARPRQMELEFAGQGMTLAVSPHTWLDGHYFSVSPETLQLLAEEITLYLKASPAAEHRDVELEMDSGHHWRIILTPPAN
jgi:hypothetical protein